MFDPGVGRVPWGRKWLTHSSILAWEIPGTEAHASYSPWGRKESDTIGQALLFNPIHTKYYHFVQFSHSVVSNSL